MKVSSLILGGVVALVSLNAFANDDLNRTVTAIGTQTGTGAYARFAEGTSANCTYGVVYLGGLDDPTVRGMMAILIAAKQSGGKIADIAYTVHSDGSCLATKVESQ